MDILKTSHFEENNRGSTANLPPEKIPVYIPDEDAKKFLVFQQYFEPISILLDAKVFEQRNATILIDFDKDGVLRSVRRQDFLYSFRTQP